MYIIIVGCGRVGLELARLLASEGHNVVIIDKNADAFLRLGTAFNGLTLVGNGFDVKLLKSAGIEKADAFCSVTNGDNTNLVSAQVAKTIFKVPKVIARVYDPTRAHIYRALGLDIISGTLLFAAMIRDKIIESKFSSYLIESKDIGVLELEVNEELANKRVEDLNIPGEFLIASIRKVEGVVIPDKDTSIQVGDILMAVVRIKSLKKIHKIFKVSS